MADGSTGELSDFDVRRLQRTPQGLAYDAKRDALRKRMQTDKAFRKRMNERALRIKAVTPDQVHADTFMSNMSIQYKNDDYIGEQLMPVVPTQKRSDKFVKYRKRDRLGAGPTDVMSSRSEANEVSENRDSDNYSLQDYALQNWVPGTTIENEDAAFDEMLDLVEALNDDLALLREVRIATILTATANYDSANSVTNSGSSQWNSASGGDPIADLQTAAKTPWTGHGPGDLIGFCSIDVWNVLQKHASVVDFFKYTLPGLTKMDRLAQEIGLAKIFVGAARQDTANVGQTASYSRIWGKHFGVVRVARRATLRNASFGYTLRMAGHPVTQQWYEPRKGLEGAYYAKVGQAEQHKVVANDTGFLIANAIS